MRQFNLTGELSYKEAEAGAGTYLQSCGIEDAGQDAWMLLAYVCGISRADYLADPEKQMTEKERDAFTALVEKRGSRIPLQHLTEIQGFMGFDFKVNSSVLIPRQDTEALVEKALELIPDGGPYRILDLCTGSGCIALSLAKLHGGIEIAASDLSLEALACAQENADRLGVKLRLVRSDLFAGLGSDCFDMIVSNPPYIPSAVIGTLSDEVRLHEPRIALDGGEDGLSFYRRILRESPAHLRSEGLLLVEIGYEQAEAVQALFEQNGFSGIEVIRDLSGHDRVVLGRLKPGGLKNV